MLRGLTSLPAGVFKKLAREIIWLVEENWVKINPQKTAEDLLLKDLVPAINVASRNNDYCNSFEDRFFLNNSDRTSLWSEFNDHFSATVVATIKAADKVCAHIFDLLGSGDIFLGYKFDWHSDFKSGYRWNTNTYFKRIRPAPYPGGYDIKVPWELSRCQHFVWLGQAYWFSGDEKYALEFRDQVEGWIINNPYPWGVNWSSTMDVAIRMINWLWGLYFFRQSQHMNEGFIFQVYKTLFLHGKHIFKNLENQSYLTNNHYLANLAGLIYLGALFPEITPARDWLDYSLREIERELFRQFYSDGVNFEASIPYHRLATELVVSPIVLCQKNGINIPEKILSRLEKMVEYVMNYTRPDGTAPMIGDNDNGRIHRLKVWRNPEQEWKDHRYLLAIGAVLFDRVDFALAAADQWEEALWLFGSRAVDFRHEILSRNIRRGVCLESKSFSEAGIFILRDKDIHILVDVGSIGQNDVGGHAHNDVLSFELFADGQTWIIDPGTYIYTADYEARNRFRSTDFHNTVMIDGFDQYALDGRQPFRMFERYKPKVVKWEFGEQMDELVAEFTSSSEEISDVIQRRKFELDKEKKKLRIIDEIRGKRKHNIRISFHTPAEVYLNGSKAELFMGDASLKISSWKNPWHLTKGFMSEGYGQRREINKFYLRIDGVMEYTSEVVFDLSEKIPTEE
jgi:hypothetical protein